MLDYFVKYVMLIMCSYERVANHTGLWPVFFVIATRKMDIVLARMAI